MHGASAVGTFVSEPVFQVHIRAGRVVRLQDLPNEHEEIEQPTLSQSVADRNLPLAFAQRVVLDVRVRRVFVAGGRVALHGDDIVRTGIADVLPVQHDLELAKVDALQFDRISQYGDDLLLHADFDLVEFTGQRAEVSQDVVDRRERTVPQCRVHRCADTIDSLVQAIRRLPKSRSNTRFCQEQPVLLSLAEQTTEPLTLDP